MDNGSDKISSLMKQNCLNMYHGESGVRKHPYLSPQIEFYSVLYGSYQINDVLVESFRVKVISFIPGLHAFRSDW